MTDSKEPGTAEKLFYIFMLGLATYVWWRVTATIKRKIAG